MFFIKKHRLSLLKTSVNLNKNYGLIRGNYGLKSLDIGLIKYTHLEGVRRKISKQFKRLEKKRFKIYIRIFIWKSYTKKPLLSRMGKGAGIIIKWVALVKKGVILLEILSNRPVSVVKLIVERSALYFPLKTVFIQKV